MKQDITAYLSTLLTIFQPYTPQNEDTFKLEQDKALFIRDKFCRKKYRRRKLVEATKHAIGQKIRMSLDENRPIHLVVPFGGYKHFWNPSHPEPDWAELFNFKYLTEFASPAVAVHDPGVIIEYMSEDMILTRMNNYPKEALETYSRVFTQLIEWYNEHTPDNLEFRFFRVGDRCDSEALIAKVESMLPDRRKAFDKLSGEEQNQGLHRSNRSVLWDGEEDWTSLSDEEKKEKVIESRLIELAYYDTEAEEEFIGEYLAEDNHICILSSFGTTHDNDVYEDLTLGSTYGSIVDYWIGRGVLFEHQGRLIPRIVSKNQYEEMKQKLRSCVV